MRTVIIGTGNVATVLSRLIRQAGHDIVQVAGRNEGAARTLASIAESQAVTDLRQLTAEADLYIMAVSDDALTAVAEQIKAGRKTIVHTAGSVSKEVLKGCSTNYGVLYPLQSLRREMEVLPATPFLVDGNTPDTTALISEFAQTLSPQVTVADDAQRLRLHLAAVFVSNFTNHLYALTEDYCAKEKLPFRLLIPLITAVAERLHQFSPAAVQTGPALRHDVSTIQKHLNLLKEHPQLQQLYEWFTKSIQQLHKRSASKD